MADQPEEMTEEELDELVRQTPEGRALLKRIALPNNAVWQIYAEPWKLFDG